MKLLSALILWCVALIIVALLAWRLLRGRPVLLKGKLTPRLVNMVVIILVVLGWSGRGVAETEPDRRNGEQQVTDSEEAVLPAPLQALQSDETFNRWEMWSAAYEASVLKKHWPDLGHKELTEDQLKTIRQSTKYYDDAVAAMLDADLEARLKGEPAVSATTEQLQKAIAACIGPANGDVELSADFRPVFDPWLMSYLWQKSQGLKGKVQAETLATIQGRLHQWARMNNAMIKAKAIATKLHGDYEPRAWMSKAGPTRAHVLQREKYRAQLLDTLRKTYAEVDASPWTTEGIVPLRVAGKAPVTLYRAGVKQELKPGDRFVFGRLDVLQIHEETTVISHDWLGRFELPQEDVLTAHRLAQRVSNRSDNTKLMQILTKAREGTDAELLMLERAMPLVHLAIRQTLEQHPDAKGAPQLRLILANYDNQMQPTPMSESPDR